MKKSLTDCINQELLILKTMNGKTSISVGTLVRLKKNYLHIVRGSEKETMEHEYVPYNSIVKLSTGQKVLSR